ncbi:hypothetical protein L1887_14764 [Cichorium endivia]|nr:hypothetical protein L1887_14764 [Cichorium endivia]
MDVNSFPPLAPASLLSPSDELNFPPLPKPAAQAPVNISPLQFCPNRRGKQSRTTQVGDINVQKLVTPVVQADLKRKASLDASGSRYSKPYPSSQSPPSVLSNGSKPSSLIPGSKKLLSIYDLDPDELCGKNKFDVLSSLDDSFPVLCESSGIVHPIDQTMEPPGLVLQPSSFECETPLLLVKPSSNLEPIVDEIRLKLMSLISSKYYPTDVICARWKLPNQRMDEHLSKGQKFNDVNGGRSYPGLSVTCYFLGSNKLTLMELTVTNLRSCVADFHSWPTSWDFLLFLDFGNSIVKLGIMERNLRIGFSLLLIGRNLPAHVRVHELAGTCFNSPWIWIYHISEYFHTLSFFAYLAFYCKRRMWIVLPSVDFGWAIVYINPLGWAILSWKALWQDVGLISSRRIGLLPGEGCFLVVMFSFLCQAYFGMS